MPMMPMGLSLPHSSTHIHDCKSVCANELSDQRPEDAADIPRVITSVRDRVTRSPNRHGNFTSENSRPLGAALSPAGAAAERGLVGVAEINRSGFRSQTAR